MVFKFNSKYLFNKRVPQEKLWLHDFHNWTLTSEERLKYNNRANYILFDQKLNTFSQIKGLNNNNTVCFAELRRLINNYHYINKHYPKYIGYNINNCCLPNYIFNKYIWLMNVHGLFGNEVNIANIIKYRCGFIKNPVENYDINQLFFILSNYRTLIEHPILAKFVVWCYDNFKMFAPVAIAAYNVYKGCVGHHYLTRKLDIKFDNISFHPLEKEKQQLIAVIAKRLYLFLQNTKKYNPTQPIMCNETIRNLPITTSFNNINIFTYDPKLN